jgi:hypothetical protein
MNNLRWMMFMLTIVCLSVLVVIVQLLNDLEHKAFDVFERIVFAIFAAELGVRMYCWKYTHTGNNFPNPVATMSFFKDRYHNLDVVIVALDIVIMIVTASAETGDSESSNVAGQSSRLLKIMKAARVAKLLRVLRAARIVNALQGKSLLHSAARVRRICVWHQWIFFFWFFVSFFLLPIILKDNLIADKLTMIGMCITITDFCAAMLIICADVKRMLSEVMANSTGENGSIFRQADLKRKLTVAGVAVIGPPAIVFTLAMGAVPFFEPDASFWFLLCATLAVMWDTLVFILYNGPRLYLFFVGGCSFKNDPSSASNRNKKGKKAKSTVVSDSGGSEEDSSIADQSITSGVSDASSDASDSKA